MENQYLTLRESKEIYNLYFDYLILGAEMPYGSERKALQDIASNIIKEKAIELKEAGRLNQRYMRNDFKPFGAHEEFLCEATSICERFLPAKYKISFLVV